MCRARFVGDKRLFQPPEAEPAPGLVWVRVRARPGTAVKGVLLAQVHTDPP